MNHDLRETTDVLLHRSPTERGCVYVALSLGMQLTPGLQHFVEWPIVYRPMRLPSHTAGVLGWGLKGASLKAIEYANRHGLPYIALEDGFLRSVRLGNSDGPLSVVTDDVGIYYNAECPSRLERLIARVHTPAERARALSLSLLWRQQRLSKYNHARELPSDTPATDAVLVVDQTVGDASIRYGMADSTSFARMLEAALDEHPDSPILLKVHPDVVAGRKRAHFEALTPGQAARVQLLATDMHPPSLLENVSAVYVVTSQMGLEAMLWNKPVRCFGMPFYAGWGLTVDAIAPPERRRVARDVQLSDLVHAAIVEYPRYVDPETMTRCSPERVMSWMGLQRRMRERFPPKMSAIGFSKWKRPIARMFFAGTSLDFHDVSKQTPDTPIVAWGNNAASATVQADAAGTSPRQLSVEDGFLRSVGLGSEYARPLSWVIDSSGMYYDSGRSCDLEWLLQHSDFDDATRIRARLLRENIVGAGITKYNVGHGQWKRPADGRWVVLVLGQVESDASIALGAPQIRTNFDLLGAVRAMRPHGYIAYKPHPDVVAGKREAGGGERAARSLCDECITSVPVQHLFAQVDEVHVMTSLGGFEALLRGLPVFCHGQPFYAGWGLTRDSEPMKRRTRRLLLDELVAGALILYPTYVSRTTGYFTTPERAVHELTHWTTSAPLSESLSMRALRQLKRWRDRFRRKRAAM